MICPYCKHAFDYELNKPIKLPCQHILCESCAIFLKRKSYICPLDNLRIKIDVKNVDNSMLEKLKTYCRKDQSKACEICLKHFEFVCEKCSFEHSCDKIVYGNDEGVADRKLNGIYESAKSNIDELKKKLSESDLVFLKYFENYFEVKAMEGCSLDYRGEMIESNFFSNLK